MVKFSCFSTNNLHHKSKKEVSESSDSMSKTSEDYSKDQELKVAVVTNSLAPVMEEAYHNPSNTNLEEDTSFLVVSCVKRHNYDSSPEANLLLHQKTGLQKSQSFGSVLDREGRVSSGDSEEFDQENSYERLEGNDNAKFFEDPKFHEESTKHLANHFAGGYPDPEHLEAVTHSIMAESHSLSNTGHFSPTSEDGSPSHAYAVHCYRSYDDLNALDDEREFIPNRVIKFDTMEYQERDEDVEDVKNGNGTGNDPAVEKYGDKSYDYPFGKDWSMDEDDTVRKHEGERSLQDLNSLPIEDFKIKRIEEWVSMIDLEGSQSLQDTVESSASINQFNKGSYMLGNPSAAKLDPKSINGMEAAKNYVSSLPATSTSMMLANHGLVVIPFLSAFVNLKTLNLSGNAIVRITSGSLPRGLHVLNLAKNNISTIEGLRELTRLRVLDLSYNRILRIGHGLASCSSLKELYLAGNKISEVEGLHRLLKLNVLDLRFNKISTTKCLGQLAANYSSLQAINLEGNPAQRNVGDEQLKKFLQNSLPHLVYYNKQTLKASTSKEVVDRSSRAAIASRQLERGLRSDHKLVRKGIHTVTSGRTSSSSGHGHRSQAVRSPKQSRDRVSHLPPSGIKESSRHRHPEFESKLLSFQSDLAMRRSRSEGNLGGI